MPVDFDAYSPDQGRIDLTEGSNAGRILGLLLEFPGTGFTPREIAEQTDIPRGSIGPTLARLEDAGLVRHKGDYWAAAEDDRLAAATTAVLGLEAVGEAYSDDWYANNPNWAEEVPDLGDDASGEQ